MFFSELRWGKAMVACTKLLQRKKEESKRLRGKRDTRSSLLILDFKDDGLKNAFSIQYKHFKP